MIADPAENTPQDNTQQPTISLSDITVNDKDILFTADWDGVPLGGKIEVSIAYNTGSRVGTERYDLINNPPFNYTRAHSTTVDQVVSFSVWVGIWTYDKKRVLAETNQSWPET